MNNQYSTHTLHSASHSHRNVSKGEKNFPIETSVNQIILNKISPSVITSPLLHDLQRQVQQLPLALLPPLDHLEDGHSPAEVPTQLKHFFIRGFIIFAVLKI